MKSAVSQRELKPSTSGRLVPKGVLAISMAKLEILVGKSNGCAIAFEKLQNIRGYYMATQRYEISLRLSAANE